VLHRPVELASFFVHFDAKFGSSVGGIVSGLFMGVRSTYRDENRFEPRGSEVIFDGVADHPGVK
jgi:hypothetical protein